MTRRVTLCSLYSSLLRRHWIGTLCLVCWSNHLSICLFASFFPLHAFYSISISIFIYPEIKKLTSDVEAVLLGVVIPLCQRNSGKLDEIDREVNISRLFLQSVYTICQCEQ